MVSSDTGVAVEKKNGFVSVWVSILAEVAALLEAVLPHPVEADGKDSGAAFGPEMSLMLDPSSLKKIVA
jgi:hypothetical protein